MAIESTDASANRAPQILAIVAVIVAVLALAVGVLAGGGGGSTLAADIDAAADDDLNQAVTLVNGTVYYGKITHAGESLVMEDVYYLTGATVDNPSGSLVKRGAEIHAPTGKLVIAADDVLQVDNVGANSIIARGIERIEEGGGTTTTTEAAAEETTTTAAATETTTG